MSYPAKSITLYLDITSPFTYLVYYLLRTSPLFTHPVEANELNLTIIPMSIRHLMITTKNRPPFLMVELKREYIRKDLFRQARRLDVPLVEKLPENFPMNPIYVQVQNMLHHIYLHQPTSVFLDAVDKFYAEFWSPRSTPLPSTPADLRPTLEILFSADGKDPTVTVIDEIIQSAGTEHEINNGLKALTEEAIQTGCFGLPWFVVSNGKGQRDAWWGADQLDLIAEFLQLEWPEGVMVRTISDNIWSKKFKERITDAEDIAEPMGSGSL